jgi:hypothetical protein
MARLYTLAVISFILAVNAIFIGIFVAKLYIKLTLVRSILIFTKKINLKSKMKKIDGRILFILEDCELTALDILDRLNINRFFKLGFHHLYPALNRLEKQNFIFWRWGDNCDLESQARRKYYCLAKEAIAPGVYQANKGFCIYNARKTNTYIGIG